MMIDDSLAYEIFCIVLQTAYVLLEYSTFNTYPVKNCVYWKFRITIYREGHENTRLNNVM